MCSLYEQINGKYPVLKPTSRYLPLFLPSCALKELETLGKELYGAKIILQKFQVRKCPHFKSPVPASECLLSMLEETNPHHYFVATQVL